MTCGPSIPGNSKKELIRMALTLKSDTHPKVEKLQIELLRKFTVSQKLNMVSSMTIFCQKVALAGIKKRYPNATKNELRLRLASLWLDKKVMRKVFSWNIDEKGL